jgi:hypothetical protein
MVKKAIALGINYIPGFPVKKKLCPRFPFESMNELENYKNSSP